VVTHYPISSAATDSRAVNVSLKKDDTQCVQRAKTGILATAYTVKKILKRIPYGKSIAMKIAE
jgi:hypothetical protein